MGSLSKPSAPSQPDYTQAANAQGAQNIEAARLTGKMSNPNINTPYGSQQVTWNGDQPTVDQTLSPAYQGLFNMQTQNQQGLGNLAGQGIQNAGQVLGSQFNPNLPQAPINPGTTASQAMLSRIEPQIAQSHEMNAAQLANQGIMQGSEAYNNAMRTQGQQENDLRLQAGAAGIPYDMQARQQALQEQTGLRELPLNEISALMSGSQVQAPQFQQFQGSQVTPSPTFAGAQAQGQATNNVFNQQMGAYNNMMGGLFGLGGAGITGAGMAAMSDRRLKKNINLIGKWKGHNLYTYDYIWGEPSIGVMADEVEMINPSAVTMRNGFKAVYYGRL